MFVSLAGSQAKGKANKWLKASCIALAISCIPMAQAQWQDPLITPSQQAAIANKSLMLDVAQAGQRILAAGAHGHILYSDDQGLTWRQAQVPVSLTLTALYFPTAKTGWAVGHDGIVLKSSDAGATWVKQFDGYQANNEIVAGISKGKTLLETQFAAAQAKGNGAAMDELSEKIEDLEFALEDAEADKNSGSTKPFLDVWFANEKEGFVVGAYGMFFRTKDGGKTWQNGAASLPNPERFHINAIAQVGKKALMMAGEQGLLLRSDDLGKTWVSLDSPYDGSFFGIAADGNNQLVFGLRGNVFRSNDGGISWTAVSLTTEQALMSAVKLNNEVFLIGNGGSLIRFDDKLNEKAEMTIQGRKSHSSGVVTSDGKIVLVGESGIIRITAKGELLKDPIRMAGEGK